jgi:hypothetical protein
MAVQAYARPQSDPGPAAGPPPREALQRLVDQAGCFNVFTVPAPRAEGVAVRAPGCPDGAVGVRACQPLHRFDIDLQQPSGEAGVRAANVVGEAAGRLDLRWMMMPYDFLARPDREPPPTRLDPGCSQRFAMQEMTFTLGERGDGLSAFGTGRTFPVLAGGRPRLLAAAVGNVTAGTGKFQALEGNLTLCGELTADAGFLGHVLVRVVDPDGCLCTRAELPPLKPQPAPDPGTTYLFWGAQHGKGADQDNRFSLGPDGQVRGMNVPTQLKFLRLGFAAEGPEGFRCRELCVGDVMGQEVGFGRGTIPGAPATGTPFSPFLFEGVARYSFFDRQGKAVGALTTNVLEGRRFDLRLRDDPGETAWRFGFFGPVVLGTGCFHGARGLFYGASASVFRPPPGDHVITHLYAARLDDPDGRFRAAAAGAGH